MIGHASSKLRRPRYMNATNASTSQRRIFAAPSLATTCAGQHLVGRPAVSADRSVLECFSEQLVSGDPCMHGFKFQHRASDSPTVFRLLIDASQARTHACMWHIDTPHLLTLCVDLILEVYKAFVQKKRNFFIFFKSVHFISKKKRDRTVSYGLTRTETLIDEAH